MRVFDKEKREPKNNQKKHEKKYDGGAFAVHKGRSSCNTNVSGRTAKQRFTTETQRHREVSSGEPTSFHGSVFGGSFAASPSSPAIPLIASMQNAMCSSRSTPRPAAPLIMSSRLTERAKALSFMRFRTDLASTSASDLLGLISAVAVMKPASSSQANSVFSRFDSRLTPV